MAVKNNPTMPPSISFLRISGIGEFNGASPKSVPCLNEKTLANEAAPQPKIGLAFINSSASLIIYSCSASVILLLSVETKSLSLGSLYEFIATVIALINIASDMKKYVAGAIESFCILYFDCMNFDVQWRARFSFVGIVSIQRVANPIAESKRAIVISSELPATSTLSNKINDIKIAKHFNEYEKVINLYLWDEYVAIVIAAPNHNIANADHWDESVNVENASSPKCGRITLGNNFGILYKNPKRAKQAAPNDVKKNILLIM